jgi:hypothetical protein
MYSTLVPKRRPTFPKQASVPGGEVRKDVIIEVWGIHRLLTLPNEITSNTVIQQDDRKPQMY